MNKEKKSYKGIINIVLIIGFIIFCAGLYQIGTVTFLAKNMQHIDDSWVPAMDNESRGYYMSYFENDTLNIISKISYRETLDYVINNPYELFEENMTGVFQDLKKMGYKHLYWFDDAETIVVSKSYYEYENNADSYKIKLHDWFLGDSYYWIWTLESKGDSQTAIIFSSFTPIVIGLIIMIFCWAGLVIQKGKEEALMLEKYRQSRKEQQNITINSSIDDEIRERGKVCQNCGLIWDARYKFCPNCGKKREE